ncbi:MAG: secretin N-terminal domain-containing protein, partial [bacterium]
MTILTRHFSLVSVLVAMLLIFGAHTVFAQGSADSAASLVAENPDDQSTGDVVNSEEEGLRLNFRGVPLTEVLDYLSKAAGFVIVLDTEVSGRVDVWSHQPLNKEEAVNLLNTILNEKGYAAVRNGRTLTIVNRDEARQRNLPVRSGSNPDEIPKTDEMVTQIIPVRYTDAVRLIQNLDPLLPSYATLSANETSNAVVVTDTQANIRRIAEIIQALDTSISSISSIQVFPLVYADATEIADVINKVFEVEDTSSQSRRGGRSGRMGDFFARMRGDEGGGGSSSSQGTGDST